MSAHERLSIADAAPQVLIDAAVAASPERQYAVTLKPGNGSTTIPEHDCLRFALHYYARALYELARRGHSVRDLPASIDRLAAGPANWNDDLFHLAGLRGKLIATVGNSVGEVRLQLRRCGYRSFELTGDIPFTGVTLATSVVAVLQAIALRVSPDVVDALRAALANMNASYVVTHRYSDPMSCREVPAIAYNAAAFAQG